MESKNFFKKIIIAIQSKIVAMFESPMTSFVGLGLIGLGTVMILQFNEYHSSAGIITAGIGLLLAKDAK